PRAGRLLHVRLGGRARVLTLGRVTRTRSYSRGPMHRQFLSRTVRSLVSAAVAIVALAPIGYAQATGTIEGTVTITAGSPLPDVQVAVVGTSRGARSDDAGKFRIPGLAPGSYQVRAQRIGYASTTRTVTVAAGPTA